MNKLEALNYLVNNDISFDEWSEAGMYHALCDVIKSESEDFTEEYLKELLEQAESF